MEKKEKDKKEKDSDKYLMMDNFLRLLPAVAEELRIPNKEKKLLENSLKERSPMALNHLFMMRRSRNPIIAQGFRGMYYQVKEELGIKIVDEGGAMRTLDWLQTMTKSPEYVMIIAECRKFLNLPDDEELDFDPDDFCGYNLLNMLPNDENDRKPNDLPYETFPYIKELYRFMRGQFSEFEDYWDSDFEGNFEVRHDLYDEAAGREIMKEETHEHLREAGFTEEQINNYFAMMKQREDAFNEEQMSNHLSMTKLQDGTDGLIDQRNLGEDRDDNAVKNEKNKIKKEKNKKEKDSNDPRGPRKKY